VSAAKTSRWHASTLAANPSFTQALPPRTPKRGVLESHFTSFKSALYEVMYPHEASLRVKAQRHKEAQPRTRGRTINPF